uniref:Secreted protein n=1 Tax=Haemonchus placei TaxID=6290 RepID=A0A0N4X883_HAEPC
LSSLSICSFSLRISSASCFNSSRLFLNSFFLFSNSSFSFSAILRLSMAFQSTIVLPDDIIEFWQQFKINLLLFFFILSSSNSLSFSTA